MDYNLSDKRPRPDTLNTIANVSDRTYRRGLAAALFLGDVLAGFCLLGITSAVLFQGFGGGVVDPPRAFPLYWITVVVLGLITFGLIWNVRAEARHERRYLAGKIFVALSFLPLLAGIAMLASTP